LVQDGGMRNKVVENIEVQVEGVTDLGIIRLDDGQTLAGQVMDQLGIPLAGVRFMAMKDGSPLSSGQSKSLNTGEFQLKSLPDAPFTLFAYHDKKTTLKVEVNDFNPLVLRMTTGATIQVQLLGTDVVGRRISIVTTEKSPTSSMWNRFNSREKISNSQGELTLEHVSSGRYLIKVAAKTSSDEDTFSKPFEAMDGLPSQVMVQGL
jgi:hypothetical protein